MRNLQFKTWKSLRYTQVHYKSTKSPFSDTVLLPATNFPAKVTASTVKNEKLIQEKCEFLSLYEWQRNRQDDPVFVLHDGPPYANGDVHVGHALNKILKDITNRYKMMRGYQVHFMPGWDCHGLPIEIKAIKEKEFGKLTPPEIRKIAHEFAAKTIEKQKQAFIRWGVMANWSESGCYFTYSKEFESKELEAFHAMYKKGNIYRALKPVYWSPSSATALAEAELEYCATHKSRSAYISFPLHHVPHFLNDGNLCEVNVVVWTTQPWTIPANQAVCYSETEEYCLIQEDSVSKPPQMFLVAEKQLENFRKILNRNVTVLQQFQGSQLKSLQCCHPMNTSRLLPLLPADHVTMDMGTGFVHIAPAHGFEDFMLATEHGLDVKSGVDDHGLFTCEAGFDLKGKFIFDEGNRSVLNMISENNKLLHEHDYVHSYPYDWRTNKPIFIKTSKQWFIDTEALRSVAKEQLENVNIIPSSGMRVMTKHLTGRTYWCISRQRVWGVPIPVFYHRKTRDVLFSDASFNHILSVVKNHGTDAWWNLPMHKLLPQPVIDQSEFPNCTSDDFERGMDILDIWFDSGVTWAAVLGKGQDVESPIVADLYLEGKDQFGGWFQSSLFTSCAIQGKAPYKNIFSHGFVISESGQKMSKSLGNVINPEIVTDGGKNFDKDPPYGADVLRWWVAESNVHHEVIIGERILNATKASLNKIRLFFRYLLGNLSDFQSCDQVCNEDMRPVDRYVISLLCAHVEEVSNAYDQFDYGKVTRLLLSLMTKLSSFYFTVIKDRLYCEERDGLARRSCQTALHNTLNVLSKSAAPILPHTMEEVNMHHSCKEASSVFKSGWCEMEHPKHHETTLFSQLLQIREGYVKYLEGKQAALYDLDVHLAEGPMLEYVQSMTAENTPFSELREILGCSRCSVVKSDLNRLNADGEDKILIQYGEDLDNSCVLVLKKPVKHQCQRCRLFTAERVTEPCERCADVIARSWAT